MRVCVFKCRLGYLNYAEGKKFTKVTVAAATGRSTYTLFRIYQQKQQQHNGLCILINVLFKENPPWPI